MKMQSGKRFPVSMVLFIGVFYAILNGLGLWQLERYHQKIALLKQVSENKEAPIMNLEHLLSSSAAQAALDQDEDQSGLRNCLYRRVALEGRFLHEHEIHLYPRTHETQPGITVSGFHVVTPFQVENGAVILINRGWAPLDAGDLNHPLSKRFYRPKGPLRLIATLHPLPQKSPFSPNNDMVKNHWFKIDLREIAQKTGFMTLMPVFAIAEPYTPEGDDQWMPGKYDWPIFIIKSVNLNNNHLEYALVWYLLSLVLVMMFLYYQQRWYLKNQSVLMGFKELGAT